MIFPDITKQIDVFLPIILRKGLRIIKRYDIKALAVKDKQTGQIQY